MVAGLVPPSTPQVPEPSNVSPSSLLYQAPVGQLRTVTVPPVPVSDALRVIFTPLAWASPV